MLTVGVFSQDTKNSAALLAMLLTPGTWLCFSLSYARGNYREFLGKWRIALGAAFLVPIILEVACRGRLVDARSQGSWKQKQARQGLLIKMDQVQVHPSKG